VENDKVVRTLGGKGEDRRKEVLPPVAGSQQDSITILLGLKGYRVEGAKDGEQEIVVEARGHLKESTLPRCGCPEVHSHGESKPRKVLHSWIGGKRVYLELHWKRWRCRERNRSFSEGTELL